jgi:photosystem II stability/assembly factor-like uncharacterized protein
MKKGIAVSVSAIVAVLLLVLAGPLAQPQRTAPEPNPSQSASAHAAPVWQSVGPAGGWIRALVKNPKNARELYAAVESYPCQIFKSSNSGSSWKRIGLVQSSLSDLIVHPTNPNILYGVANNSVYKSKDQGKTFTELKLPDPNLVRLDGNISISPRKPETIYIAGSYKYNDSGRKYCLAVYRSKDGGLTWTVHKLEPVSDYASFPRVAASPARAGLVFASGSYTKGYQSYYRVFKSSDGGTTWTNITGSISELPYDLVLHPADPNKVYVSSSGFVYRSSDGGKTWAKQADPDSLSPEVLAMDSKNPQVLYAGTASVIYKSTDGGVHWTASKSNAGLFGSCSEIVAEGGSVYYASTVGIFKSADGGATWKPGHAGMKASIVPAFALAAASPETIFAEIRNYACFKSANAGGGWIKLGSFAGCGQILKIVSHPTSPNTVYLLKGG